VFSLRLPIARGVGLNLGWCLDDISGWRNGIEKTLHGVCKQPFFMYVHILILGGVCGLRASSWNCC